ncbi:hypothetical protein EVA_05099 [gut metagenome]|uniref:Uncharacterized protein n=1 Tax=gut metagenome TaxID=749906 RepID=J9D2F1_9ZZZZ
MRATFHESIGTAPVRHHAQQPIEFDGIGRGMFCRELLAVNIIANRRAKSALVTQATKKLVKQSRNGGLTIGTSHSDELQPRRGVAIEYSRHLSCSIFRIGNTHKGHPFRNFFRYRKTHQHGNCTLFTCLLDVGMSVCLRALYCNKQMSRFYLAGINIHSLNFNIQITAHFLNGNFAKHFRQFHHTALIK